MTTEVHWAERLSSVFLTKCLLESFLSKCQTIFFLYIIKNPGYNFSTVDVQENFPPQFNGPQSGQLIMENSSFVISLYYHNAECLYQIFK